MRPPLSPDRRDCAGSYGESLRGEPRGRMGRNALTQNPLHSYFPTTWYRDATISTTRRSHVT